MTQGAPITARWGDKLTGREVEVCIYVAEGLSNKEIGPKLGISHRTVEDHRANAMRKLGVKNAVQLIRKVLGVDP